MPAALGMLVVLTALLAAGPGAAATSGGTLDVAPIEAYLQPPVTYYYVMANSTANLSYAWTGNISCGEFKAGSGNLSDSASWAHPDGPPPWCDHSQSTSHVGTITVVVSDGASTATCTYEGSESGTGPPCEVQAASTGASPPPSSGAGGTSTTPQGPATSSGASSGSGFPTWAVGTVVVLGLVGSLVALQQLGYLEPAIRRGRDAAPGLVEKGRDLVGRAETTTRRALKRGAEVARERGPELLERGRDAGSRTLGRIRGLVASPGPGPGVEVPAVLAATDPCGPQREAVAAAEARLRAAEEALHRVDDLRVNAREARAAAAEADAAADAAKAAEDTARRAAGGRWSADATLETAEGERHLHREGWQDPEAGARAEAAAATARQARSRADDAEAAARKAQGAYDAAGGDGAWDAADHAMVQAREALDEADAALTRCLRSAHPTPVHTLPTPSPDPDPVPPSPPPATTTGGGGGGRTRTREPPCTAGETRNRHTTHATVTLIDLSSLQLMHESYRSPKGNIMEFVDWLQNVKDGFFLAKTLWSGGEAAVTRSPGKVAVTGTNTALGAAGSGGIPDFLTYYDKMGQALLDAVRNLDVILDDVRRDGEYWVEYKAQVVQLTCTRWEECDGSGWRDRSTLEVEELRRTHGTTPHVMVQGLQGYKDGLHTLFQKHIRTRHRQALRTWRSFADGCQGS